MDFNSQGGVMVKVDFTAAALVEYERSAGVGGWPVEASRDQ